LELGEFIVFRGSGDLASSRSLIEQFRQRCEIDRNLSRLVDHQEAGLSCRVRVGSAIEKAELAAGGVIDGKSVWEFGDPPWPWKAASHVEILKDRKSPRTDDDAEPSTCYPKEKRRRRLVGGLGRETPAIGHRSHDSIIEALTGPQVINPTELHWFHKWNRSRP